MPSLRSLIHFTAALAILLAPSASAADARGELDAGAIHLSSDATFTSLGLDAAGGSATAPVLELDGVQVDIQRFGTSSLRADPGAAPVSNNVQQVDAQASHPAAKLTLVQGAGDQIFALRSLGAASGALEGATVRGIGGALLADAAMGTGSGNDDGTQMARCELDTCLDVFGAYGITGDAAAALTGELTLLLYWPTLRVVADDGTQTDYASGITSVQDAGPASQTEDAWVMVRAKTATGTLAGALTLYSTAPTLRATQVAFDEAEGAVRVGAREYRAAGDDVAATGAIVLTPAAVAPAPDHGIDGESVYATSFTTRVSGDVQSIDLEGQLAFLDSPAEKAGAAALLLALAGGAAYAWQHLTFGFAAMYTRLHKPDILENDVRSHIYDIIRQQPGISAREAHRQSNQSWGTVVYHLRQLERHHLVVSRALGRTRNYYENHGKYKGMEVQLACLQSERARVLARAIASTPGITQEALALASQFPQPTTSYYVRKLKQAGLVEEQREGRYVKYVPHADLPRFLSLSESSVQASTSAGTGIRA